MPICCAAAATRARRAVNHSIAFAGEAPLASLRPSLFVVSRGALERALSLLMSARAGWRRASYALPRALRNDSLRLPAHACVGGGVRPPVSFRRIHFVQLPRARDQLIMDFHSLTLFALLPRLALHRAAFM